MSPCRRRLAVDDGNEDESVDHERAHNVYLERKKKDNDLALARYGGEEVQGGMDGWVGNVLTTVAWPHHHCSLREYRAWATTVTALPTKVRAAARDSHSKSNFRGRLKSRTSALPPPFTAFFFGSGFPPGPVCSSDASALSCADWRFEAIMLCMVKVVMKKTSRIRGYAKCRYLSTACAVSSETQYGDEGDPCFKWWDGIKAPP